MRYETTNSTHTGDPLLVSNNYPSYATFFGKPGPIHIPVSSEPNQMMAGFALAKHLAKTITFVDLALLSAMDALPRNT